MRLRSFSIRPLVVFSYAVSSSHGLLVNLYRQQRSINIKTIGTLRSSCHIPSGYNMEASGCRRSARLQKLRGFATMSNPDRNELQPRASNQRPRKRKESMSKLSAKKPLKKHSTEKSNHVQEEEDNIPTACLPRTREKRLKKEGEMAWVMGIDEAGRGPLAGPVVAAAAVVTQDIAGVVDSKKMTKEEEREELYERIVSSPNVRWAVAVVDAARIDNVNILQATLQGMQMAATAVMKEQPKDRVVTKASAKQQGCYVVCGETDGNGKQAATNSIDGNNDKWYALVDGNRVPDEMPCEAEALVKGDSKEYSIAAASILAKVTRDRLMREYDAMYPEYHLGKHKGYPTAAHMAAVKTHGASPIHRRTFAPLKHMVFDENGGVVEEDVEN